MAEAKSDKPAKKPKNVGAILIMAFSVVNFAVMGAGVYFVYASTLGWVSPKIKETQLAEVRRLASVAENQHDDSAPLFYTLDKMTVNLSGEPKRMMRVEVSVELLNPVGFVEIMEPERGARVKDRVMSILSEQSFTEVESIQGKLYLKDRLARELNEVLDKGIVKGIYFSEFVVQ